MFLDNPLNVSSPWPVLYIRHSTFLTPLIFQHNPLEGLPYHRLYFRPFPYLSDFWDLWPWAGGYFTLLRVTGRRAWSWTPSRRRPPRSAGCTRFLGASAPVIHRQDGFPSSLRSSIKTTDKLSYRLVVTGGYTSGSREIMSVRLPHHTPHGSCQADSIRDCVYGVVR